MGWLQSQLKNETPPSMSPLASTVPLSVRHLYLFNAASANSCQHCWRLKAAKEQHLFAPPSLPLPGTARTFLTLSAALALTKGRVMKSSILAQAVGCTIIRCFTWGGGSREGMMRWRGCRQKTAKVPVLPVLHLGGGGQEGRGGDNAVEGLRAES